METKYNMFSETIDNELVCEYITNSKYKIYDTDLP
jgi:hypothetical protein